MPCANNKDTDQPAHLRSLFSVFVIRFLDSIYRCYILNFKTLASLSCWAGRFESYLVENPEDGFSRDKAHFISTCPRSDKGHVTVTGKYKPENDKTNRVTCAPSKDSDQFVQTNQFPLSAWRNHGPLATHWAYSEDSDQTGWMPRLIWVFAERRDHFEGFVMLRLIPKVIQSDLCHTCGFFPGVRFFIICGN